MPHFTVLKAQETSFWDEKDPENCLQSTFLLPFLLFSWIYCDYKCFRYHTAGTLRESSMIHIHLRNTLCLIARTLEFKCRGAPYPFFRTQPCLIITFWSFHRDNLWCAKIGALTHLRGNFCALPVRVSLRRLLLNYSTMYDKLSWKLPLVLFTDLRHKLFLIERKSASLSRSSPSQHIISATCESYTCACRLYLFRMFHGTNNETSRISNSELLLMFSARHITNNYYDCLTLGDTEIASFFLLSQNILEPSLFLATSNKRNDNGDGAMGGVQKGREKRLPRLSSIKNSSRNGKEKQKHIWDWLERSVTP